LRHLPKIKPYGVICRNRVDISHAGIGGGFVCGKFGIVGVQFVVVVVVGFFLAQLDSQFVELIQDSLYRVDIITFFI